MTGISLGRLLVAADFDPRRGYDYATVTVPGGAQLVLYTSQLFDDTFPDGPAVLFPDASGSGTKFLRPAFGDTEGELIRSDTLTVRLFEGSPLSVSVTASPTRTDAGRPVQFRAEVAGAEDGSAISYSWRFGDGGSATDTDPGGNNADDVVSRRYTYAKASGCPYTVSVTVRSASSGAAAPVTAATTEKVQVGPRADDQKTCKDVPTPTRNNGGGGSGGSGSGGGGGSGSGSGGGGSPANSAALDSILDQNAAALGEPASDETASEPATKRKRDAKPKPKPKPKPASPAAPPLPRQVPIVGLTGPAVQVRGEVITLPLIGGGAQVIAEPAPTPPPPEKTENKRHWDPLSLHIPAAAWAALGLGLVLLGGAWVDTQSARAPRSTSPFYL